jgi:ATP-dependent Clp protease protease subunit
VIAAQLLVLEAEDPEKDISLYINSPGGSAYAGMAIYDAMQYVKPDVRTVCIGMGMSAAAMILAAGAPGKRFVLPNAKVMIHQGSGGFRGTPADIQIAAREIQEMTRRMAELIARHTGQEVDQVMQDIDRDRFMAPEEAVAYGLVDEVLERRPAAAGR